jgi:hypothetical protein
MTRLEPEHAVDVEQEGILERASQHEIPVAIYKKGAALIAL